MSVQGERATPQFYAVHSNTDVHAEKKIKSMKTSEYQLNIWTWRTVAVQCGDGKVGWLGEVVRWSGEKVVRL